MKKFLIVLLSFFLITTVFTSNVVKAEDGYPDITGFQLDENGVMTWDPVEHAVRYSIFYGDDIHTVGSGAYEPSFEVFDSFKSDGLKSGTYQITVEAKDANDHILARSKSPSFEYVNDN